MSAEPWDKPRPSWHNAHVTTAADTYLPADLLVEMADGWELTPTCGRTNDLHITDGAWSAITPPTCARCGESLYVWWQPDLKIEFVVSIEPVIIHEEDDVDVWTYPGFT